MHAAAGYRIQPMGRAKKASTLKMEDHFLHSRPGFLVAGCSSSVNLRFVTWYRIVAGEKGYEQGRQRPGADSILSHSVDRKWACVWEKSSIFPPIARNRSCKQLFISTKHRHRVSYQIDHTLLHSRRMEMGNSRASFLCRWATPCAIRKCLSFAEPPSPPGASDHTVERWNSC